MIDLDKVERLMALMEQYGMDVVQAESGRERVSLAKNAADAHFFVGHPGMPAAAPGLNTPESGSPVVSAPEPAASAGATAAPQASQAAVVDGYVQKSELVGTFYRAPSPDVAPFVELGQKVRRGQTLCIVEAMKIMNEIEAEEAGEVVEILVENGKPVEFGAPLFVIKKA